MSRARVAMVGGDARVRHDEAGDNTRRFGSPRDGGRGELRRLESALRAGTIDRVVILTRWNSHSCTARVKRLCRTLGIELVVQK